MIPTGTHVRITTTNGGDTTAILTADYRPTFPAFLRDVYGNEFVVDQFRLKSIAPVAEVGQTFRWTGVIHLKVVGFLSPDVAITEDHGPRGDGRRGTMAVSFLAKLDVV